MHISGQIHIQWWDSSQKRLRIVHTIFTARSLDSCLYLQLIWLWWRPQQQIAWYPLFVCFCLQRMLDNDWCRTDSRYSVNSFESLADTCVDCTLRSPSPHSRKCLNEIFNDQSIILSTSENGKGGHRQYERRDQSQSQWKYCEWLGAFLLTTLWTQLTLEKFTNRRLLFLFFFCSVFSTLGKESCAKHEASVPWSRCHRCSSIALFY